MEYTLVSPVRALRERPTLSPAELERERRAYQEREAVRRRRAWARALLKNDQWDMHARRRRPSLWGASRRELLKAAVKRWPQEGCAEWRRVVHVALTLQQRHDHRRVEA